MRQPTLWTGMIVMIIMLSSAFFSREHDFKFACMLDDFAVRPCFLLGLRFLSAIVSRSSPPAPPSPSTSFSEQSTMSEPMTNNNVQIPKNATYVRTWRVCVKSVLSCVHTFGLALGRDG